MVRRRSVAAWEPAPYKRVGLVESVVARIAVITPSYRQDLALCRDLNASLRVAATAATPHLVIVPPRDVAVLCGVGTVRSATAYLPRFYHPVPGNLWLNTRRPWPLVRGWITQQLIKLAAAAAAVEDIVVLADSDMVFVRKLDSGCLYRQGAVRFYRAPDAIDGRLPRHVTWHHVAHSLLGLPPPRDIALPDYISWPMTWDPAIVRSLLRHVAKVAGVPWETAIGGQLHFSEGILYGVYVDHVLGGSAFTETWMLSAAYSDPRPLELGAACDFAASIAPEQIALMISAKSATDIAVRRQAIAAMTAGRAEG